MATFETIIGKIRDPTARRFFLEGMTAIRASVASIDPNAEVLVAQRDTPEFAEWLTYFDSHLHWRPYFMTLALADPAREVTLPRRWPRWFDQSFPARSEPAKR